MDKKSVQKILEIYQQNRARLRVKDNIDQWVSVIGGTKLGNNTIRVSNKGKENIGDIKKECGGCRILLHNYQ